MVFSAALSKPINLMLIYTTVCRCTALTVNVFQSGQKKMAPTPLVQTECVRLQ